MALLLYFLFLNKETQHNVSLYSPNDELKVIVCCLGLAVLSGTETDDSLIVFQDGFMRLLPLHFPSCLEQLNIIFIEELNAYKLCVN